ncbi:alpha-lytic protease prodomain-containing protein [Actinoplanes oblitus]|uniref:Alpha-lytic protease prodomain-containing protein n=1 Tax=Actinoplanes oblitus TaxID=3040509 RepID=A0ABY8WU18_9ACTN|nr:carbohydrate-binding protein [Actinoplanes oblitus]WIN00333.1 alpha-lytic protease prodomain-containing protein [Actinoplanes oblitus]
MSRRSAATLAAALAAATVAALSPTPHADAATAPAGITPGLFAALRRDLRLTPAQATARLQTDQRASRTQQVLRRTLGARYGGTWVSGNGATVQVGITDDTAAPAVRALGAEPVRVPRSEAQLRATVARLDRVPAPAAVEGWYADLAGNTVVVLAHGDALDAGRDFARRAGVPGDVRVRATTENPRPYLDVIGGNAYYIGSGTRCSVGFSVTGGFVTAGHCGQAGARTSQPAGTFQGSTFPGRDYAWVRVDAGNTPRGLVNNYSGGTVAVAGSSEAAVGAAVCRSGSTTGWHCGTIQQKNASVTYAEGTVSGLTRTDACAEPGDSGGSWLAGNQAQGVTSGGSGNCTSGGVMYFQPVNPILAAYGLTLVTSGDPGPGPTGPTTPAPGGTWAPGVTYATGAQVTYGGATYRCLQQHTSMTGWEPPNVPALWQRV